ncbi:FUSC family protein [Micromonospora sp. DT81.3]|uniref:FUSC family protein n=1 Tax=Micromonospora sp. DT81.3 TaxID=3416523 RepID=UPI003CF40E07
MQIVLAVLVAFVAPVVLLYTLAGPSAANAMVLGVLVGALGSKIGGTRRMLYLAPVIGLAAGLGAVTAYRWWWVGLLAATGVVAGAGIGFGSMLPLLMIPWVATFASPAPSGQHAVVYGVIVGVATGYGIALARRFGAAAVVEGKRVSVGLAAVSALVFGVILGAAAAIGVALGWPQPFWVPEPILLLALYVLMGRREKITGKAIGTAVGAVAAIPIALIAPPTWVLALIAAAAFVLAFLQTKAYWLSYGLYTFGLVLVLAPPGEVASEAEQRGVQILAGIALLVVGLVIFDAASRWLAKHFPQPELAPGPTETSA